MNPALTLNANFTMHILTTPIDPTVNAAQDLFPHFDSIKLNTFNECSAGYFKIDTAAIDAPLCMGTVAVGALLVLRPDTTDIDVKIATGAGPGLAYTVTGGVTSIMFFKNFTGLTFTNNSGVPVSGRYCICGD